MTYSVSANGKTFIQQYETGADANGNLLPQGQPALTAYDDGSGVWTIGWGHTAGVYPGMTITYADAVNFFNQDIATIVQPQLNELYIAQQTCGFLMTQQQVDAVAALLFNVGDLSVAGPRSWQALLEGDLDRYLIEASEFIRSGGIELDGLKDRRADEAELFTQGDYARSFNGNGGSDNPYAPMNYGERLDPNIPAQWQVNDALAPLYGTSGNDALTGGDCADTIYGGGGNDVIHGLGGTDRLIGGAGDDTFYGGGSDDFIDGGTGSDTLIGGAGDDLLDGGDGIDRADYGYATEAVIVDLEYGEAWGGFGDVDTLVSIESVHGSAFADVIYGNDLDNVLIGGAGDDYIFSGAGHNILEGGDGDDTLEGRDGNDVLEGGAGDDTLLGEEGHDTLRGGAGDDYLDGLFGDDTLEGGAGDDFLNAYEGDDVLNGGAGDDLLWGGTGADTFVFRGGDGADTIIDFDTADDVLKLNVDGFTAFAAILTAATQGGDDVVIDFGDGDSLTLQGVTLSNLTHNDFMFV